MVVGSFVAEPGWWWEGAMERLGMCRKWRVDGIYM